MKRKLSMIILTLTLALCSILGLTACGENEPPAPKYYTVTWQNYDGSILETDANVKEGLMPTYDAATPTKESDAEFTYEFSEWSPEIKVVDGDITYIAQFSSVKNKYTVTWKDYDGTVLELDESVEYGTIPTYNGITPTRERAQYTYSFSGWDKNISEVTGNVVYTAQYSQELSKFTVVWKNYDGTVLKTDTGLLYQAMPEYAGQTPTREKDAQYTYTFTGWAPTISKIVDDVVYIAQYSTTINKYTVTWKNYDGSILETDAEVPYGSMPTYGGNTPTKEKDVQYTYAFDGWDKAVSPVVGDITYTAKYTNTVNKYTITWKNHDGTILKTDSVAYGSKPNYTGTTPTKQGDVQYGYIFDGWTPSIVNVTGEAEYKAIFKQAINKYTVTWKNYDGTVITTTSVEYGKTPSYTGTTPSRQSDAQYNYLFTGWSPEFSEIEGDVTYTAQYSEQEFSSYTIKYDANGGTGAPSSQTKLRTSSITLRSTTPTKSGYIFVGWNNIYENTVYQPGDTFNTNINLTLFAMWKENCSVCNLTGKYTESYTCSFLGSYSYYCEYCGRHATQNITGYGTYFSCSNCGIVNARSEYNKCSTCNGTGSYTRTFTCDSCPKLPTPTTSSVSTRSVTLTKINNYEYSMDGINWQSSNVFNELIPNTSYIFYQREATHDGKPFGLTSPSITVTTQSTTQYYVKYELNGGVNSSSNPSSYYSTSSNRTLYNPTKEHYVFDGWIYNGNKVTAIQASWAKDITLTATWAPKAYSISYALNGGESINETVYNIESNTFTLNNPIRTGYTFIGWTGSNGEVLSLEVLIPAGTTGDLSYTANWSINQYNISFVTENGQSFEDITQDYNTAIALPIPTWTERSFVGWFDKSLTTQFTRETMPAENVTLYAKWINYEVTLIIGEIVGISINDDLTDGSIYGVTAIDTDNNPVFVKAQLLSGSQTSGTSITVRFVATGLYGVYATQMVSDIKVYGMPAIEYNITKNYINYNDSLEASLFAATATDTYGETLFVNVSIKQTEYTAGDIVTIILSATDRVGNATVIEIKNVKYYGIPTIVRDETVTEIKASDTISNVLFNVVATDSFGEPLTVTTQKYSGTFAGGYTITVKSSTTDSKGNTAYITYQVKVYGIPTITSATKTNFKEGETITLSSLGIVANDSFDLELSTVQLELVEGEQVAGATMIYKVIATDHLGNISTKLIDGIKIYGQPTIIYKNDSVALSKLYTIAVSFDLNGAEGTPPKKQIVTKEEGVVYPTVPVRNGYAFAGWYLDKDCIGDLYDFTENLTESITLYAKWVSMISINDSYIDIVNYNNSSSRKSIDAYASSTTRCYFTCYTAGEYTIFAGTYSDWFTFKASNISQNQTILNTSVGYAGGSVGNKTKTFTANAGDVICISVAHGWSYGVVPGWFYVSGALYPDDGGKVTSAYFIDALGVEAKDSFGNTLSVTATLDSGEIKGGSVITVKLVATDEGGNTSSIITDVIRVYAQEDIKIIYNAALSSNIKKTSCGEEFNAIATDSFGEECTISVIPADGYSLTEGTMINLYLVATDKLGNSYRSNIIIEKNVYDTPTLTYAHEYDYITPNDNPYLLFKVTDSFGKELLFDVELVSGSLDKGNKVVYRITAKDKLNNKLDCLYTLDVINYDENGLMIYRAEDEFVLVNVLPQDEIIIPHGITTILKSSFDTCQYIQFLALPTSINEIEEGAFENCLIENVSIPSVAISYVPKDSLKTITIISGEIEKEAFKNCSNLLSATLNNEVTSIGDSAFSNCSSLKSVKISTSVEKIERGTFYGCSSLEEITLPFIGEMVKETNSTYQYPFGYIFGSNSFDGALATKQYYFGSSTSSVTYATYYIPKTLKKVTVLAGNNTYGAFSGCSNIEEITLPYAGTIVQTASDTIQYPFGYVFGKNSFDESIAIEQTYFSTLDKFGTYIGTYYVPKNLKKITILGGDVPNQVFENCFEITDVILMDGVTSIGNWAFENCISLETIQIPNTVSKVGNWIFEGCGLLKYEVKDSLCYLGNTQNKYLYLAGVQDANIINAIIDDGCRFIGWEAFSNCALLKSVIIPGNIVSLGSSAFDNCSSLSEIELPSSIKEIGASAFSGCTSLISVILPKGITSIDMFTFYNCSSLEKIEIPNSVTSIGWYAFERCTSLISVKIPNSVIIIGDNAFMDCSMLEKIIIPSSVAEIEGFVFQGCNKITIYCEAQNQPTGWNEYWNNQNLPVVWGCKIEN